MCGGVCVIFGAGREGGGEYISFKLSFHKRQTVFPLVIYAECEQ